MLSVFAMLESIIHTPKPLSSTFFTKSDITPRKFPRGVDRGITYGVEGVMTLREYRKLKGWTQDEVRAMLDLKSVSAIAMIENGQRRPSPQLAAKIEALTDKAVPFRQQLLGRT